MAWTITYRVAPGNERVISLSDELKVTNMAGMAGLAVPQGVEHLTHALELLKLAQLNGYKRIILDWAP